MSDQGRKFSGEVLGGWRRWDYGDNDRLMGLKQLRLAFNVTRVESTCSAGDYLCHKLEKATVEQDGILPFHQVDVLSAVDNRELVAKGKRTDGKSCGLESLV